MVEDRARQWFGIFCEEIGCTDGFRKQLETQLARQFRQATELAFERFMLEPPAEGPAAICFDADGTSYLDIYLVGPDGYAHPASIAWRLPGRERLLPSDPALDSDAAKAEIRWRELPADTVRARYGRRSAPWPASDDFPFDTSRYSFEIEWEPFAWPDLWLRIETDRAAFPEAASGLIEALEQVRGRWNAPAAAGAERGIIHNLGTLRETISPEVLAINVDFGSAGPQALVALLDALQQHADRLGIRRVVVRGPQ